MKVKSSAFNQSKAALPLSQKQPHLDYPFRASLKTISRVHHICLIKQLQKKKKKQLYYSQKKTETFIQIQIIFSNTESYKSSEILESLL